MLRSKVCKNAYQIISTFNGEYGKHVFEASGALRGPQEAFRGPQGVKIPLRSKVCKNAYQIISTFNGEYGKHNFEASGALRGPSGGPQGSSGGPQGAGPKIVVGISNRFYVVLGPLLAPTPNFLQIR